MNAIIGYIELAKREKNLPQNIKDFLHKIDSSSQHLLALINDVLEMSRIESGKMELEPVPIDLVETLDEVRDMFTTQMQSKEIDFFVDSSQVYNGKVLCDKNRLNRVLLNLLSNAYKFTPEGGTVSVSMWQIEDDDSDYGNFELRVRDSGIGMTPEFAARVFDAFERERTSTVSGIQGTGLGMAITKSIVDMMGGTIEVETAPEEGTEFIIRLRLKLCELPSDEDKEDTADNIEEKDIDFSKMRILLVDDVEINREIASLILDEMGFSIDMAQNGKEALDKVKDSPAGTFDAILMDIQMPVMNGYDATGAIRELEDEGNSSIPIIAMTANAFAEDVQAAHDAGMDGHIAKPIDVAKMVQTLKEVL